MVICLSNKFTVQAAKEIFQSYPWLPKSIPLTVDSEKNYDKRLEIATKLINDGGKMT